MKVSQLLEFYPDIYLVAGSGGKDRIINYVDVVEIIEGTNWVKEGDFIITTGYFLSGDPNTAYDFVNNLIKKNVSGIGIKLGKHLKKLPQAIISLCNKNQFPIVCIPQYMMYREIMQPANDYILSLKNKKLVPSEFEHIEQLFIGIVNGTVSDNSLIRETCDYFGLSFKTKLILCQCNFTKITVLQNIDHIINYIKDYCRSKNILFFHDNNNKWYFLCKFDNSTLGYNNYYSFVSDLHYTIKSTTNCNNFLIGVSLEFSQLSELYISAIQTNLALSMGNMLHSTNPICFYIDYAVSSLVLDSLEHPIFQNFYSRTFLVLENYDKQNNTDLLSSLIELINNNFNINKTVDKLFIHRNTMYKRLDKISELLGPTFDINSFKTRELMLLISKYHKLIKVL